MNRILKIYHVSHSIECNLSHIREFAFHKICDHHNVFHIDVSNNDKNWQAYIDHGQQAVADIQQLAAGMSPGPSLVEAAKVLLGAQKRANYYGRGQLNEYQEPAMMTSDVVSLAVGAVPEGRQRSPFLVCVCVCVYTSPPTLIVVIAA